MRTLLAFATFALFAQDPAPVRNSWADAAEGSWVVIETIESADAKTSHKRHRFKVDHQPDGKVVCHVSEESDKPAIFFEERTIESGRGVEEGAAKIGTPKSEPVEIGGKKIVCEVVSFALDDANATGKQAATVWTTKEFKIPYREWNASDLTVAPRRLVHSTGSALALDPNIVRYEMNQHDRNGSATHRFRVVELDRKLKVGDREIACVVEEGTIEEKGGPEGTTQVALKRWLSDVVPGRVVRSEMRGEVRGVKVERTRQVVSYSLK